MKLLPSVRAAIAAGCALTLTIGIAGCSGAGGGAGSADTINVLMVGNSQMTDIQQLTFDGENKDPDWSKKAE